MLVMRLARSEKKRNKFLGRWLLRYFVAEIFLFPDFGVFRFFRSICTYFSCSHTSPGFFRLFGYGYPFFIHRFRDFPTFVCRTEKV